MSNFLPYTEDQVHKIIMSMPSKSCELDSMPTYLLKEILSAVLPTITKIINLSLMHGLFVSTWKSAVIRPLLKKTGLDLITSNYRPVSNLTFLSKVLEKTALEQFMQHCNINGLFPTYQSAYRKDHSCETALTHLIDDLLWAMEKQKVTAMIMIDLSSTFDTVDHDILLTVLNKKLFGIENQVLGWFDSYLTPHTCKVNVGNVYSAEKNLDVSVPQGSCAGAVLFSAYASMLASVIPSGVDVHGYADNHALKTVFRTSSKRARDNHGTV